MHGEIGYIEGNQKEVWGVGMEKRDLIQRLEYCKWKAAELAAATARYEDKQREMNECLRKPALKEITPWRFSALLFWALQMGFLVLALLFLFLFPGMQAMAEQSQLKAVLFAFALLALTVGLAWSLEFFIRYVLQGKRQAAIDEENEEILYQWQKKKVTERRRFEQELSFLEQEKNRIAEELNAYASPCGLHYRYQNETALSYLIYYLRIGRSDTLKEAVNLYETEVARYWKYQQETQYRQWMEQTVRNEFDKLQKKLERNAETSNKTASQIRDATESIIRVMESPSLSPLPGVVETIPETPPEKPKKRRLFSKRGRTVQPKQEPPKQEPPKPPEEPAAPPKQKRTLWGRK